MPDLPASHENCNPARPAVPSPSERAALADRLRQGALSLGQSLEPGQVDACMEYLSLLVEQNREFNLTAVRDPSEMVAKHFIDSMAVLPLLPERSCARLADVGTGAGFPGLALKIYRPDLEVTLIDSVAKRLRFVSAVVERLGLRGVEVQHQRAEGLGHDARFRERFDGVVARAVGPLRTLVEICLPLARVNGTFVAMKGPKAEDELAQARNAIRTLGGAGPDVRRFVLPLSGDGRTLVVIRKVRATPALYPRRPDEIRRKPL